MSTTYARSVPVDYRPVLTDQPRAVETVRDADSARPAGVVPRDRSERANRVMNFTLALSALVALSPVLLVVSVLIKLTSRGPIFYRQTRVGLDRRGLDRALGRERPSGGSRNLRLRDLGGAAFTIYKFRSMAVNAEGDGGAVWASKQDARVTAIGKVMRQLRIDELPQLINVVRGDMNIVGPRPERPSIFLRLRADIPEYPQRQLAKPGITGWAQINNAYDASLEDVRRKVELDLEYIRRQSLAQDVKIMLQTIPVMVFRKGGW
jgi:lipopolysaccharide/colanic/teichoic acid biosynthesis glycosyltransferase